ncbi:cysteine proteinase inhibitor 1-like [Rosa sericea]
MMRTQCLLLGLLALLLPLVAAVGDPSEDQIAGGWEPIKNISDPHVQDIAKWAVTEYNQQSHKALFFLRVVQGQEQVVAGTNYKLVISVKDGSSTVNYEGFVFEKLQETSRKLVSFTRK